jgi:hypothetical protein
LLRYLEAQENLLTGTVPVELTSLVRLLKLDVSSNLLTGSIATEFCSLINDQQVNVTIDCGRVQFSCGCSCSATEKSTVFFDGGAL